MSGKVVPHHVLYSEEYRATNIEKWKSRLFQSEHPEYYSRRGKLRYKTIKAPKDDRLTIG